MPEKYPILISNHYPLLTHPAPWKVYPMSESDILPLLSVHIMYTLVRRAWLFWRLSFIFSPFRSLPCFQRSGHRAHPVPMTAVTRYTLTTLGTPSLKQRYASIPVCPRMKSPLLTLSVTGVVAESYESDRAYPCSEKLRQV